MNYLDIRNKNIVLANDIIQGGKYRLSAQELKIVFFLLSQISPDDDELKVNYKIPLSTFYKTCGISHGGQQKRDILNSLHNLETSWIMKPAKGKELSLAWSRGYELDEGTNTIEVTLDQRLKPFLIQLKQYFTQMEMIFLLYFRSKYSIYLYSLIKSIHYDEMESYTKVLSISELKQAMRAETYEQFRDFHSRALKPAVKEINEYSDKSLIYDLIKQGRNVTGVRFTISTKPASERIKIRNQIEQEMGLEQFSLW